MRNKTFHAVVALFVVSFLWGLTFPSIKEAMTEISPVNFVALRFFISIVLFLPLIFIKRQQITKQLLLAAFIFGSLESLCYLCQSIGLQTISSAQSAFVTAFSVVIAPFLAPLFGVGRPRYYDVIASVICLIGILILTQANLTHIKVGILWTFACAIFYAISVNYLSAVTKRMPSAASSNFVAWQVVMGLPIPLALSVFHSGWSLNSLLHSALHPGWSVAVFAALIFCSITTMVTYFLQTRYQKYLSVGQFMLIYAFEPVFASIFGVIIGKEVITRATVVGGLVILSSFIFSTYAISKAGRSSHSLN